MAQGVSTVLSNEFGTIITANGTSFSGPVLGMVWLLLAGIPTKTNKEIRDLIIQSSDKYAAPTAQYGYGIPNFSLALTRSVKDFDKNYFVPYPNPTLKLFRSGFQKF
jgi:hypothetical protein